MQKKHSLFFSFIVLFILTALYPLKSAAQQSLYVHASGKVTFISPIADIDSVAVTNNNKYLRFYNTAKKNVYTVPLSRLDSITFADARYVADLLDVKFNADGTARDASPMGNTVRNMNTNYLNTYYNDTYGCYAARFNSTWGYNPTGYYRVDYANNEKFKAALADGHSMEMVFAADYDDAIPSIDGKIFTSHEAGGTGFSVPNRNKQINFVPNVSTTGTSTYIWVNSGVTPRARTFYHAIGVWDKEAGKAYVYVNGKLCKTLAAKGEMVFPTEGSEWFALGCDANADDGGQYMPGDLVIARIYDRPLTQSDVTVLWNRVKPMVESGNAPLITHVRYLSGLAVQAGHTFEFRGKGCKAGDKLTLSLITSSATTFRVDAAPYGPDSLAFTVPQGIQTGRYRMVLSRGEQKQDLGTIYLVAVDKMPKIPTIYAHRGYWDTPGSAQNSIASYKKAIEAGIDGIEIDVWLTTDNYIVVNHDASYDGVTIQNASLAEVKQLKLSNGETMPELKDFLELAKQESHTKLLIELKSHSTAARNMELAQAVVQAVADAGLKDKVIYHAFNLNICREVVRLNPEAEIGYLNKNLTPAQLKDYNIPAMNYNVATYRANPSWIPAAQSLGLKVNAWTPDQREMFIEMMSQGVDCIGTNKPIEAMAIRQYYIRHFDQ